MVNKLFKTLKNSLLGMVALGSVVYPSFVSGTRYLQNTKSFTEMTYNLDNKNSFEKLPEGTYETKKEDFSKDFEKDGKYFHINEKGDTIVSSKTKNTLEDNLKSIQDYSQDPRYGLNMYVPAYDSTYSYTTDFYGSGDINGDGVINQEDVNSSITSIDPFNDGNYRGDTDLDGDVDAADKQIIQEYVDGFRNQINVFELAPLAEKITYYDFYRQNTPTKDVNAISSGWDCYNYGTQDFIYCNGIYDIENSPYAENNGTNLQYDLSHNGIFRIPLRRVATVTTAGVPHEIVMAYLGSPENQNSLEFTNRIYSEPQTGNVVVPGDYSMDEDEFANESWHGYCFSNALQKWDYYARSMVKYDLSSGSPSISFQNPDLVLSWNPFEQIKNPEDQDLEFSQGMVIDPGYPDSLYYAGTKINHLTNSNQTSNGSCSDVTFEEEHLWNYEAGAYNSSNTPSATHIQYINVHDFTAPEFTYFPSDTLITKNDSMSPDNLGYPEATDNSGLPIEITYEDELLSGDDPFKNWARHWTATDVCGNQRDSTQYINVDLMDKIGNKTLEDLVSKPYPMPTKGKFNVNYELHNNKRMTAEIYDMNGRLVDQFGEEQFIGKNIMEFDISNFADGMYFLEISADNQPISTQKIIKQ